MTKLQGWGRVTSTTQGVLMKTYWAIEDKNGKLILRPSKTPHFYTNKKEAFFCCYINKGECPVKVEVRKVDE